MLCLAEPACRGNTSHPTPRKLPALPLRDSGPRAFSSRGRQPGLPRSTTPSVPPDSVRPLSPSPAISKGCCVETPAVLASLLKNPHTCVCRAHSAPVRVGCRARQRREGGRGGGRAGASGVGAPETGIQVTESRMPRGLGGQPGDVEGVEVQWRASCVQGAPGLSRQPTSGARLPTPCLRCAGVVWMSVCQQWALRFGLPPGLFGLGGGDPAPLLPRDQPQRQRGLAGARGPLTGW